MADVAFHSCRPRQNPPKKADEKGSQFNLPFTLKPRSTAIQSISKRHAGKADCGGRLGQMARDMMLDLNETGMLHNAFLEKKYRKTSIATRKKYGGSSVQVFTFCSKLERTRAQVVFGQKSSRNKTFLYSANCLFWKFIKKSHTTFLFFYKIDYCYATHTTLSSHRIFTILCLELFHINSFSHLFTSTAIKHITFVRHLV